MKMNKTQIPSFFSPLWMVLIILTLFGCAVRPDADISVTTDKAGTRLSGSLSSTKTVPPFPSVPGNTSTPVPSVISGADEHVFEQNRRLGRGINLGNALEAPSEGEWGVTLNETFFSLISSAGFDSVRIPIRWSAHADSEFPYTIDPVFFKRVDWAIEQAFRNNLRVVINIHHYDELMENPRLHHDRFLAIWEQIALHYQDYPESLYFELLNEPHGPLSVFWNDLAAEAIRTIRKTNPERTLIVGPGNWNNMGELQDLTLPETDRNLIVTVHYYSPFEFTHQGAEWVSGSEKYLGTPWEGKEWEKKAIDTDFDLVLMWSQKHHRPIFLGEFGAYSKADMDSRKRWTEYVARSAEKRGFSWAYWEFCAGFGVYNPQTHGWVEPLLTALIPSALP